MKTEIWEKENFFSIVRINFILLLFFTWINNLDYFSTYLSIANWGVEINPVIQFMLWSHLLFFVYKILVLPCIVWYFVYESESRKVMWNLVWIDLVYLIVVWGNLRVVF
jgi:hypothetical protein